MSSSSVSFLSFANPEKGDPNSGIFILLSYFISGFRPTTSSSAAWRKLARLLRLWGPRVAQRLQEGDDRRLLRRCHTEVAHLAGHVGRVLGCRPAGAGYVTGVVEVDDLLEALEVAVVAVRLHEAGARPRVDVAQCRHLEFAEFRCVDRHVVAGALQVPAKTQVDPGCAQRIEREFRVERVLWVFWRTVIVVCEVGEQHLAAGRIGGAGVAVGA